MSPQDIRRRQADGEKAALRRAATPLRTTDVEQCVRGASWPEPDPGFRDRVLAAAVPAVRPSVAWEDRVWYSRGWRLAAVAVSLALVAAEFVSAPAAKLSAGPTAAAAATAQTVMEVARQEGFTPEQSALLGRRALESPDPAGGRRATLTAIESATTLLDVEGGIR
jgi:hypothetical protein